MNKINLVDKWILTGLLNELDDNKKNELSQLLENIDNFLSRNRHLPDGIFIDVMCDLYRSINETDFKKIHTIFVSWYDKQDYSKYLYSKNKIGNVELIWDFEKYYFDIYLK